MCQIFGSSSQDSIGTTLCAADRRGIFHQERVAPGAFEWWNVKTWSRETAISKDPGACKNPCAADRRILRTSISNMHIIHYPVRLTGWPSRVSLLFATLNYCWMGCYDAFGDHIANEKGVIGVTWGKSFDLAMRRVSDEFALGIQWIVDEAKILKFA